MGVSEYTEKVFVSSYVGEYVINVCICQPKFLIRYYNVEHLEALINYTQRILFICKSHMEGMCDVLLFSVRRPILCWTENN